MSQQGLLEDHKAMKNLLSIIVALGCVFLTELCYCLEFQDERCGTKVCYGKKKCCKIQTCADKCYLGLKDPDPQTWTCEEVCPLEKLDCQDYIANHCRNFGNLLWHEANMNLNLVKIVKQEVLS